MNYIQRATTSVKRRPGKTVILMLLVLVLGTIISGAITIQQAVKNTEKNLRSQVPPVATVVVDYEAVEAHEKETGEWKDPGWPEPEVMQKLGELPQVNYFDYSAAAFLYSNKLEKYETPDSEMNGEVFYEGEEDGFIGLDIKGVQDPNIMDIQQGLIKLVSGRTFTTQEVTQPTYVALVSKNFAEVNEISIGSTITLESRIYDWDDKTGEQSLFTSQSYDMEIIGIYEPLSKVKTGDEWNDHYINDEMENKIYVPNTFSEAVNKFSNEAYIELYKNEEWIEELDSAEIRYRPVYALHDSEELVAFKEAAQEILPEFFIIEDMSNSYAAIASSMENMEWLASLILWVAVGATLLILSLLIILYLRDRKHEIGIYLALGEKKQKVITQILLEVVTTAMIAMTCSLFLGSLISSGISESMLRKDLIDQQAKSDDSNYSSLAWMGYSTHMETEDMMSSYDISLNSATILAFYGIGVGTILVSTIAPTVYITRLNPKKIMM